MSIANVYEGKMTEKELTATLMKAARDCGYLAYHTWRSFHSPAGFPDCVFVKPGRLIIAELKGPKGKVSPAQQEWLDTLRQVTGIEVYLWREDDLEEAYSILLRAGS